MLKKAKEAPQPQYSTPEAEEAEFLRLFSDQYNLLKKQIRLSYRSRRQFLGLFVECRLFFLDYDPNEISSLLLKLFSVEDRT